MTRDSAKPSTETVSEVYIREIQEYLKRAVTPMLVLRLLDEKPMYPFQINKELQQRSEGHYTTSCYPTINRLLKERYVEESEIVMSENGSRRRSYKLTSSGQAALRGLDEEYKKMQEIVRGIMQKAGISQ